MAYSCPRCGWTSHNPNDEDEGYCGRCHDWTGGELTSAAALEHRLRVRRNDPAFRARLARALVEHRDILDKLAEEDR